jgi:hypothetical protein
MPSSGSRPSSSGALPLVRELTTSTARPSSRPQDQTARRWRYRSWLSSSPLPCRGSTALRTTMSRCRSRHPGTRSSGPHISESVSDIHLSTIEFKQSSNTYSRSGRARRNSRRRHLFRDAGQRCLEAVVRRVWSRRSSEDGPRTRWRVWEIPPGSRGAEFHPRTFAVHFVLDVHDLR